MPSDTRPDAQPDTAPSPPRLGGPALLGLRLLLAGDLVRLGVRRWAAYDASVRTLATQGFPSAAGWLAVALLAGGVGVLTLVSGWRTRWGAALTGLVTLPVIGVFSATYVPAGWPSGLAPWLVLGTFVEDLLLGGGLFLLFLLGSGPYTLGRGARHLGRRLRRTGLSPIPDAISALRRTPPARLLSGD
jgi:uncharacterized membrane protein YphA (DoxX/SURF4 family)